MSQPEAKGKKQPARVALVQMSCGEDPDRNLAKALARVEEAAAEGAHLVCLPELFRTLYFCQAEKQALFDLAEEIPGPTTEALGRAAARCGVAVVTSVFEKRAPGLYHNTAVVFDTDGGLRGLYRKMHIPHDPLYYEKYYFTPGDMGFVSVPTRPARIGPLICWDQWYPEAARITALKGAEILVYPTAIGWHPSEKAEHGSSQLDAWTTIQRAHAIANGVFVAAVNRVGTEGRLEFWGSSFVADPFGRVLARAASAGEEILFADCDLASIEDVRRNWPFLRDRRVDAYGPLTSRYEGCRGRERGPERDSGRRSRRDSGRASEKPSDRRSEGRAEPGPESERGSERRAERGSERRAERGSERNSERRPERRSARGSERRAERGSERSSERRSERGSP